MKVPASVLGTLSALLVRLIWNFLIGTPLVCAFDVVADSSTCRGAMRELSVLREPLIC